jgi:hypothetical protein
MIKGDRGQGATSNVILRLICLYVALYIVLSQALDGEVAIVEAEP